MGCVYCSWFLPGAPRLSLPAIPRSNAAASVKRNRPHNPRPTRIPSVSDSIGALFGAESYHWVVCKQGITRVCCCWMPWLCVKTSHAPCEAQKFGQKNRFAVVTLGDRYGLMIHPVNSFLGPSCRIAPQAQASLAPKLWLGMGIEVFLRMPGTPIMLGFNRLCCGLFGSPV